MDYAAVLEDIGHEVRRSFGQGKVARYIPALARVPPDKFGIAIRTVEGEEFVHGDADEPFSVQSVSKVLALMLALDRVGTDLWRRVGREPSGTAFNSLVQLETEHGIPRNPFINAGALVVTDCLLDKGGDPQQGLLDLARRLAENRTIGFDLEVAESEKAHGHLNAAIAHFLKSRGNLVCEVEAVLDAYFHHCALAMTCRDLARAFGPLANGGCLPGGGARVMPARRAKRINAVMLTCGVYDGAGDFAYRVGLPAKSGVGGGIAGVIPRVLSVCVWSPELDRLGNSHVGTRALELFTTKTGLSVF